MEEDRRTFLKQSFRYVLLTGAASVAWDHILAGAPEQAPNYRMADHWWGMTLDIDLCIGSGNCVRACKDENNVPLGEGYFRTWVERYRVDPDNPAHPIVDSPNGGYDGFEPIDNTGDRMKTFFVPKMCNHCVESPCTQVCPVGATFFPFPLPRPVRGIAVLDRTKEPGAVGVEIVRRCERT